MSWPTLTEEQKQLLFRLIELDDEAKRNKTDPTIYAFATFGGGGVKIGAAEFEVDFDDVVELTRRGYLSGHRIEEDMVSARISPESRDYYREIKTTQTAHDQLAEEAVRYIEDELPEMFRQAAASMKQAGELLWAGSAELTTIGHKVREAMQEFSQVLYDRYCPAAASQPIERNKTRNKVAAFRERCGPGIGATDRRLLDAIVGFWDAADELTQKMEHGSIRSERPLTLADAKRLVLLVHLTMRELVRFAISAERRNGSEGP